MNTENFSIPTELSDALKDVHPGECLLLEWSFFRILGMAVERTGYRGFIELKDDFGSIKLPNGIHVYWFRDDDVIWYRKEREDDEEFQRKVMYYML